MIVCRTHSHDCVQKKLRKNVREGMEKVEVIEELLVCLICICWCVFVISVFF